ncbi:MAG TPA: CotH kinase family protein [Polyangiaceae bacterium]|nr:CotH kinase family protein [Polyangiaceae bacterium]
MGGGSAGAGGGAPSGAGTGGAGGTTEPNSDALYAPDQFPRFDIELPEASLAALAAVTDAEDPAQNDYVSASLTYRDQTITNIGLRIKGEGSFQQLDRKPAFKLKFDEFVPQQSFFGLRRLTLNNAFEDPSFVAERLAYDVFRAAGLPAPRCNNATVYINGTYYGVYVNVEPEDKTFLRRWFANDAGNLYEEGQRDFVPGAEQSFNLETNEALDDRSDLTALIAAIDTAGDDTFLEDIGGHLDTEQFLRFTAAEAAVNQWDMYAYTVFFVNNLRIYSDPTSGKFSFIPWGMDLSMKPYRDSGRPYIHLFDLSRQGDASNTPISAGLIFRRCLDSAPCRAAYADAARSMLTVYEGLDLEQRALDYYDQIHQQVLLDTRKNICCAADPALSNEDVEAGFQSVLATIRGRAAALRADLDSP